MMGNVPSAGISLLREYPAGTYIMQIAVIDTITDEHNLPLDITNEILYITSDC